MKAYPIRLVEGQDLKQELDALTRRYRWDAACILTAVGSLTEVAIRFADQADVCYLSGHFEIVSLTGTLCEDGSHLHLSISDEEGITQGGHLKEGALVATTVELVLGILDGWQFRRVLDLTTGYPELEIGTSGDGGPL